MFTSVGQEKSITQQVEFELTKVIRTSMYLPGQKNTYRKRTLSIVNC